jgi:hypothetical protein
MDTPRRTPRIVVAFGVAAALVAALAGCTNTVSLTAAPSANAAACAAVQVRLPDTVDAKFALRSTNAQSTAAWGSPTVVVMHCGVAVPTVSDLPCFSQGSLDWIRDATTADRITYTTFGRTPAVQVTIDTTTATPSVLQDLGDAVSTLPKNGKRCLDPGDVQN